MLNQPTSSAMMTMMLGCLVCAEAIDVGMTSSRTIIVRSSVVPLFPLLACIVSTREVQGSNIVITGGPLNSWGPRCKLLVLLVAQFGLHVKVADEAVEVVGVDSEGL